MISDIETLCRQKEQELLDLHFKTNATSETIDGYPLDLPLKIEAEYRLYLAELWKKYSDKPLVLEEQKLRTLITEDDREAVATAYEDARRITLRERLTRSNHEDVAHYVALLAKYARELLDIMRIDFLEEITGNHINCKAFDD